MEHQRLSDRLLRMSESATLKMAQMARDLRTQGHDIITLSLGEPDFDTPEHIKDAAKKALDEGYTKYTPVAGLMPLREAIVEKFRRDNNLDFSVSQIVVSNGAKQSIANLSLALLNKGDEVIIFTPYWVSYYEIVRLGGGVPVPIAAGIENDYKVTPEQLKNAITDKTRMILFSSPCNPTGSVFNYDELKAFAEILAERNDIIILSDEIYEFINFGAKHVSIGAFEEVKDQTVTINGFSKGFAMTGWRLGYIGAPEWIAKACAKIQGQFTSGASAFGQMAAAHALNSPLDTTHAMKDTYLKRRDMMIDLLEQIPLFLVNRPPGAFYIFPDISAYFGKSYGDYQINDSSDFAMYLLKEGHVALVAGAAFGNNNCIRISYAASDEQLRESVKRIKEAVAKLT